jgi:hypothetical protein
VSRSLAQVADQQESREQERAEGSKVLCVLPAAGKQAAVHVFQKQEHSSTLPLAQHPA